MGRKLRIILLNANSIVSLPKRQLLQEFVDDNNPDILLLTESKLSPHHKIHFKDYDIVRQDRLTSNTSHPSGGTCILTKSSLKHDVLDLPMFNSIEVSGISLHLANEQKINCFSAYHSSHLSSSIDPSDLTELMKSSGNTPFIIGGDFNSKHTLWNNSLIDHNGRLLYDWFIENFLDLDINLLAPSEPTRANSVLDFFFLSDSLMNSLSHPTIANGISDHHAVLTQLGPCLTLRSRPKLIPDYSRTDWDNFNRTLNTKLSTLEIPLDRNLSKNELDVVAENLQAILQETADLHVPNYRLDKNYQVLLDDATLHCIRIRKTVRRQIFRARLQPGGPSPLLQAILRNLNTLISQRIYHCRTRQFEDRLKGIRHNNDVYKNIKRISGGSQLAGPLLTNNVSHNSDASKADLLGETFEANHNLTLGFGDPTSNELINRTVSEEFQNFGNTVTTFSPTSNAFFPPERDNPHGFPNANLLMGIIKGSNSKKSPGIDKLSNFALKKMTLQFFVKLAILFSHLFNVGHFPKAWKHAIVCPILKPGKPSHLPTSFRPISLLNCVSKLYERFIAQKISNLLEDGNIIPNFQFGFRRAHSTTMALNIFQNDVLMGIFRKEPTLAVSLDIEKAFDTTWFEGLVHKLRGLNFPLNICSIIYQFITDRTFQVKVGNTTSRTFRSRSGVPQGSVLGPTLYNIYTSDIPTPHDGRIKQICFADDILVYTTSKCPKLASNRLNAHLSNLLQYYHKWKIKVNTDKIVATALTGTQCNHPLRYISKLTLKLNNEPIPIKDTMKYLGIHFTRRMNFVKHVTSTIGKVTAKTHQLRNALRRNNQLDRNIKLLCYKQLIRPIISYGFPIWSSISSHQMERIRTLERKILRRCTNYNRKPNGKHHSNGYLYDQANVEPIDNHMLKLAYKYLDHLPFSENPLVQELARFDRDIISELKPKPPLYLLTYRDELAVNPSTLPLYNRGFLDPHHKVY